MELSPALKMKRDVIFADGKRRVQKDVYMSYCKAHGYKPNSASALSLFVDDFRMMDRLAAIMEIR